MNVKQNKKSISYSGDIFDTKSFLTLAEISVLVVLFVFFFLVLTIPVMFVEWIIGKFNPDVKDRSSIKIVQWAFRCVLFLSGTKITVIGEENVPKDEPVLYIGNHRSYFDVVITYARTPGLCGYISKKEIERIPLLNIWMRYLHCLFLDRDNIKEGLAVILTAVNKVKNGISICIFPEGTRNDTEEDFLPFHSGSLKIAEKGGCAIVPMALNHTEDIFEAHIPWIHKTHIILEYCKPIYPKDLPKEDRKNLSNMVEKVIKDTYYKNQELV